jgi:hypothetical protein
MTSGSWQAPPLNPRSLKAWWPNPLVTKERNQPLQQLTDYLRILRGNTVGPGHVTCTTKCLATKQEATVNNSVSKTWCSRKVTSWNLEATTRHITQGTFYNGSSSSPRKRHIRFQPAPHNLFSVPRSSQGIQLNMYLWTNPQLIQLLESTLLPLMDLELPIESFCI